MYTSHDGQISSREAFVVRTTLFDFEELMIRFALRTSGAALLGVSVTHARIRHDPLAARISPPSDPKGINLHTGSCSASWERGNPRLG